MYRLRKRKNAYKRISILFRNLAVSQIWRPRAAERVALALGRSALNNDYSRHRSVTIAGVDCRKTEASLLTVGEEATEQQQQQMATL